MRKNMVWQWGKPVGVLGIKRGQQTPFYTELLGVVFHATFFTHSFRVFSQALSPIFRTISNLLTVAFYSLSTLRNNNNVSNKYLFSN